MKASPFKIALIYLLAGCSWVTASEILLARMMGNTLFSSPVISREMMNGLSYVLTTSILLYFLIQFYFRKLRGSHRTYHNLFEDSPAPMYAFDPETLGILTANNAALRQYGYTRKEFLSMTVDKIRPEDISALLAVARSGRIIFDKKKISRHFTKDGKQLYVNISAQDGFLNGKKVRWVLVRDMTEVIKNQKFLEEMMERYELTMKATKDVIWDQTADNTHVMLHGAVFENFGYPVSAAEIKWLEDKIHPEDIQRVKARIQETYRAANPYWSDQFRIRCADGAYKYISVRGFIHYTKDEKVYRTIGSVQIIQQQKEYELKIETQNQLLKELAHTVSHKLRGPLASLRGMLSLIEENENIPSDIEKEFQYVRRCSEELDTVVHQMMEKANSLYQL